VASTYSGGGNGVSNACDACVRRCGDSVLCTCDYLHVYVYVETHLPSLHPLSERRAGLGSPALLINVFSVKG
jgi:hypothetical protein